MPSETVAKFVLHGHVVTMNDAFDEIAQGAVYVEGNTIQAVQPAGKPPPAGFEGVKAVDTRGAIFPGLVELHNHLSYNALRLWSVPQKYANRDQWPDHPQYHQLVTGPMKVLGESKRADLLAALVRHVESKCLFCGVTTSQGVALSSDAGVESFYRGVVRNVEHADDKAFPAAARTHIADVQARDWSKFLEAVSGKAPVILHLSEGKDEKARQHFLALESKGANEGASKGKWAITNRLIGIHCAALNAQDFDVMAKHGGSMVWSPLSNYLLYGDTADIAAARKSGLSIALGSDWSPSGSKNLLGELKAARLAADHAKAGIADRDLVAMATRTPARMVGWEGLIGSLEKGKRADLLVVSVVGKAGSDAYKALLGARESDVALVVIDGVARYGTAAFMSALGAKAVSVEVAGGKRSVQYHDAEANPEIDSLSLADAEATLKAFFGGLPKPPAGHAKPAKKALFLEELHPDVAQRPLLPFEGQPTGWSPAAKLAQSVAGALPLKPLEVDPLTVVDDEKFIPTLEAETNLPEWLRAGLKTAL